MQIEVLSYINEATEKLRVTRPQYVKACEKVIRFLKSVLRKKQQEVLDITSRIKDEDSLKEKIVRKDIYKTVPTDLLLSTLSDIIGIRIECRFLIEEEGIFAALKESFSQSIDGINYFVPDREEITLRLETPQPQLQANGFEIYRIDGTVTMDNSSYNFELQIKSLVNSFWSEIEHKIVYKNKRFMMIDGFVSELMQSINKNLYTIDNQLHMIYERCLSDKHMASESGLAQFMTLCVNEMFSKTIEEKIGFSINIKSYCEQIVDYIFNGSSFVGHGANYGGILFRVMQWMKNIDLSRIPFGEAIVLNRELGTVTPEEVVVAKYLIKCMNTDFYTNIFFHILFSLERGNDESDFLAYVQYYRNQIDPSQAATDNEIEKALASVDNTKMVLPNVIKKLKSLLIKA